MYVSSCFDIFVSTKPLRRHGKHDQSGTDDAQQRACRQRHLRCQRSQSLDSRSHTYGAMQFTVANDASSVASFFVKWWSAILLASYANVGTGCGVMPARDSTPITQLQPQRVRSTTHLRCCRC